MKYGTTIENINLISEKAKTKRDGVYCFRGVEYRVKGGRVTHLAYNGEILERFGNFNVIVGLYDGFSDGARLALKKIK